MIIRRNTKQKTSVFPPSSYQNHHYSYPYCTCILLLIWHVSSSSYDMYPHYSYPYYGYYCHMTCILLLLIWHMCPPPHYEYYCHFINIFSHHYYLLLSKITNNCNDFWTFLPAGDGMLAERACTRVAENLVERAQWCVQLYPCAGGFRL